MASSSNGNGNAFHYDIRDFDLNDLFCSDTDSGDEEELVTETEPMQLEDGVEFTARSYQHELYKCAKKKNSILVLGTGSGKTFISILLIKQFADQIRGPMSEGNKRTVFVVNTVPLVYQQGAAIRMHSKLKVGTYEGSMGIDFWDDEQWKEELESNEVLVITAQIFLELILHARLPLRKVNLMIVDECHHAIGNHPMREIMRQYDCLKRENIDELPRVMGLTASVINKKLKKIEVSRNMHELEMTMDCALVTSLDQKEVLKFTTRPQESIVMFREEPQSEYQEIIRSQLEGVYSEVEQMEDIEEKVKKFIRKRIQNIKYIMESLGDWCVARAIDYEMECLLETAKAEEIPVVRDLLHLLKRRFEAISDHCIQMESKMVNPRNHVSHQVLRLIEILCRISDDDIAGLIFVERRNTAKILYDLFLELAKKNEDLSFIKPLYVVGANTRPGIDIKLAELELKKQEETLKKFRNGEANIIISTSVLEEGIDIRKCNAVIRFDKPMNFRAYVQSRGRARAVPSRYVLMIDQQKHRQFINELDVYREIEKTLVRLCHGRELPASEEIERHFDSDELIPPYQPYGLQGPKVTANSAISLINHYCSRLPQDKFTVLATEVILVRNSGKVQAGIQLPMCARLKNFTYGEFVDNADLAKRSAALELCKVLHAMGELNCYLRPAIPSEDILMEGLFDVEFDAQMKEQPHLGTRKHRQVYEREVCESFRYSDGQSFHLYAVEIQPVGRDARDIEIDSTKCEVNLGLITMNELICCPFNLYGGKIGELGININYLGMLDNSRLEIEKIKHFHKLAFESLLHINGSLIEFCPRDVNHGVFVVPLKGACINLDLLNKLYPLTTLRTDLSNHSSHIYAFDRSSFQDAIIFPRYGDDKEQMYYVTEILYSLNPLSEFPESKNLYTNYENYFATRYSVHITNQRQPLVGGKHLPKEMNYLTKVPLRKKGTREPPNFIPELCGVIPFKASLWWQLSCIPSILYRLNSFGVAYKLSLDVRTCTISSKHCVSSHPLNFKWAEAVAESCPSDANLAVLLLIKRGNIYPFMLSHALTLLASGDGYNMERLEVLGDSFLKYVAGEYVYLKFPDDHEGRLSPRRTMLVCNKTLFQLAKKKEIPRMIHALHLSPKVNSILPGFRVRKAVEKELYRLQFPHDRWHKLQVPDDSQDLEQVIENMEEQESDQSNDNEKLTKGTCYNPWKEHELSDKSIADCVEALIGAYLLECGSDAAKDFLHWIGIGVYEGRCLLKDALPVRSAVVKEEPWSKEEINSLYKRAVLDSLENTIKYEFRDKSFIVQAVTHPSYSENRTTESYQRLEFIGDAVLDYLVTGLIYSQHTSYTPGQMTDLRSYYVNNETLARVAAKFELHKHLLHMAPKLQATVTKFLTICDEGDLERELITEEDEDDVEEIEVPKCLGDLVEAIIGAVYLDSGRSLKNTWDVVKELMSDIFEKKYKDIPINSVRKLYETAETVDFVKVPHENDCQATYRVRVNNEFEVVGRAKRFKVAKENAAKKALKRLQELKIQGAAS